MKYWLLILGGALSFLGMLFHGVIGGKIYSHSIVAGGFELTS